jgi:DNA-binding NarL/FixJ family response regulator
MLRGGQTRIERATVIIGDPDAGGRADVANLVTRLGCDVVEATTGSEVLAAAERATPALVVLDVELSDHCAYECCGGLRERYGQALPIMLVTQRRVEPSDQIAGLLLGADEYLEKPLHHDLFTARVRRLLLRAQGRVISHSPGHSPLTPREQEVLSLLVAGVPAIEIATRLCITEKTTATHIERILGKLGAHSRAQAVAFAVRDRLVEAAS